MPFSVLLSLYHKENAAFLRKSLISIFTQTLLPDEVILVKDGPLTDALDQVVEDFVRVYPMLKVVTLDANVGLGKALNIGLEHCSYDLIARMDTDDIAKPERFEKQVHAFNEHPEIDVCGAWIDEFENQIDNVISVRKVPQFHEEIMHYAQRRNPVNHPVVMFRKKAVLQAGGYLHFPLFEDYYLWVRMLQNKAIFYNIQESLLLFRFSPDMFKRRGGLRYAWVEYKLFRLFYVTNFINFTTFAKNIGIRFVARVMPNFLRTLFYKKVVRK